MILSIILSITWSHDPLRQRIYGFQLWVNWFEEQVVWCCQISLKKNKKRRSEHLQLLVVSLRNSWPLLSLFWLVGSKVLYPVGPSHLALPVLCHHDWLLKRSQPLLKGAMTPFMVWLFKLVSLNVHGLNHTAKTRKRFLFGSINYTSIFDAERGDMQCSCVLWPKPPHPAGTGLSVRSQLNSCWMNHSPPGSERRHHWLFIGTHSIWEIGWIDQKSSICWLNVHIKPC